MAHQPISHAPREGSRSRVRVLFASAIATLLLIVGVSAVPAQAAPSDPVTFSDAALEGCIRDALGIMAPTPVTEGDMATMVVLQCREPEVADISVLQYATNLFSLELANNQVSDLSPLAGLTDLDVLYLFSNQVSDLSPLAGLTNLTLLDLSYNQVSDVSPLAGLTNLNFLTLSYNQVSDVSPLAGLTNLNYLTLPSNQVSDVSPLAGLTNLNILELPSNQVSDVSPLAGLTNLTFLMLSYNQVSDVSPLTGLTNLNYLLLDNQLLPAGSAIVGVPSPVPVVIDPAGSTVPVNVVSGSGTVTGGQAVWTEPGTSSLGWSVPATIGSATATFSGTQSVVVVDAPINEIALSGTPVNGTVGTPYSFTYTLAGTPTPSMSLTGGTLPGGLALSVDGTISGTPTAAGTFSFTVTATNGSAPNVSVESTIIIADSPTPPPVRDVQISLESPLRYAGQTQTVTGEGFTPGGTVTFELHSTPIVLGSVTAGSDGTVSYTFMVPAGTTLGVHEVVAMGVDDRTASASFTVVDTPKAAEPKLAVTGGEGWFLVGVSGVMLLVAGVVMLLRRKNA